MKIPDPKFEQGEAVWVLTHGMLTDDNDTFQISKRFIDTGHYCTQSESWKYYTFVAGYNSGAPVLEQQVMRRNNGDDKPFTQLIELFEKRGLNDRN